jgi:hypothetical protein
MKTKEMAARSKRELEIAAPATTAGQVNANRTTDAPVLTADLIKQLRSADSVEAGLKLLQPDAKPKTKADATYELNTACGAPLPQKRGACLKVVAAAVRLNRAFKVADIQAALPEVKSAPYWTRRLARSGHLTEVQSS